MSVRDPQYHVVQLHLMDLERSVRAQAARPPMRVRLQRLASAIHR